MVGTPIASRQRSELEKLIGFFANTLALRTDLRGAPDFLALCRRVREAALGAYAHQEIPFERLVAELAVERDLGHSPVFQVMLALQNVPAAAVELGGLEISPVELGRRQALFDLSLVLFEHPGASPPGSNTTPASSCRRPPAASPRRSCASCAAPWPRRGGRSPRSTCWGPRNAGGCWKPPMRCCRWCTRGSPPASTPWRPASRR